VSIAPVEDHAQSNTKFCVGLPLIDKSRPTVGTVHPDDEAAVGDVHTELAGVGERPGISRDDQLIEIRADLVTDLNHGIAATRERGSHRRTTA